MRIGINSALLVGLITLYSCASSSFDSEISKEEISAARSVAGRSYEKVEKCQISEEKQERYCLQRVMFDDTRKVTLFSESLMYQASYERHGNDILVKTDEIFIRTKKGVKAQKAADEKKLTFRFTISEKAVKLKDANQAVYSLQEE